MEYPNIEFTLLADAVEDVNITKFSPKVIIGTYERYRYR